MKASSLRVRVTTWYAGLLAAALIVFGASVYLGVERYLDAALRQSLKTDADSLATTFVSRLHIKGPDWLAGEIDESYEPENSGRFIRITRGDGTLIFQSVDPHSPEVQPLAKADFGRDLREPMFRRIASSGGGAELYTLPYTAPEGTEYLIETGLSRGTIAKVLRSLLINLVVLTPLILFAAALGGYLLMTRPLRPLVTLTEHTERIGANVLGERLPVIQTGDELERLSLALNRMISRLEDSLTHNQRFSADVSHELRTPLTIVRGELEHLMRTHRVDGTTADAIGNVLEETERMSRVVESLLTISRLDSGDAGVNRALVQLDALAGDTVDQLRLLAEEKRIGISCRTPHPVYVIGDETRLKQVLVNVLDNAIKYTASGGKVAVSVESNGRSCTVEVEDNGIGIAKDAIPFVFERFYRADKARSRESGGAGLGLSIVKAICSAHGGTVSIQSVEGVSTLVRIELPAYVSQAETLSEHSAKSVQTNEYESRERAG